MKIISSKITAFIVAILIFLCFSLSSCIPSRGINNRLLISAVGIDFTDGEYILSMQHYDYVKAGGGSAKLNAIFSEGQTIIDAFKNAEKKYGKELFYSHNKVIILSESVIKCGIDNVKSLFSGNYSTRSNTQIFFSEVDAKKLIIEKKDDDLINFENIIQISQNTALECTLLDMVEGINDDYFSLIMPKIEFNEKENKMEIDRGIVIDKKSIFHLNKIDMENIGIINNLLKNNSYILNYMDEKYSVDIKNMKCTKKYDRFSNELSFEIKGECSLSEKIRSQDKSMDFLANIEDILNNELLTSISKTINKMKDDYGIDIFGSYKMMRKSNFSLYKNEIKDWQKFFKTMNCCIECKIEINRIGLETL